VELDRSNFLEQVNHDQVHKLSCLITGQEDAVLLDWHCQPVQGGFEIASSINRFTGKSIASRKAIPWSVILKIYKMPEGDLLDQAGVRCWNREALAYQTGFLADLPEGLSSPKCYEVIERAGRECWIWMEDLHDDVGEKWPLEHYPVVGRHLGRFNGTYLEGRPLPGAPWLSQNWLRKYVEAAAPLFAGCVEERERLLVRKFFPDDLLKEYAQYWKTRHRFLDAIDCLPKCLCHQDAFRRNLFARKKRNDELETVGIDWSYMGIATIGQELAPLVGMAIFEGDVPPEEVPWFIERVFNGYLEGLDESGWHGEADRVRFCFLASWLYRYALGGLGELMQVVMNKSLWPMLKKAHGELMDDFSDKIAPIGMLFRWLYMEAAKLLSALES